MNGAAPADTALFMPDGFDVRLRHCGQPMRERGSSVTWTGKPGQGEELSDHRFTCSHCPVAVTISVRQPS
ncbi:hypothetical protein ABT352_23355 [Streptosporangium sp. NPDC000563]|uniref:hypothetical protein n=1 Tax=Streptosporangium sp. NPDC000563 TaxID=3154366 RepID=UPI0033250AA5